jgi:hypothetical protein
MKSKVKDKTRRDNATANLRAISTAYARFAATRRTGTIDERKEQT